MKNDKRGETLVEILIAVTIMALVAVPLLHPFVTSAKTNAEARRIQYSTEYAETLLEKLKAENVSTVARIFSGYGTDKNGSPIDTSIANCSFENGGEVYLPREYRLNEGLLSETDAGTGSVTAVQDSFDRVFTTFRGQPDESYTFVLPQVNINELKSDVLIEYARDKSAQITNIYSMNRSDCAYFAEDSLLNSTAGEHFEHATQEYASAGLAESALTKQEAIDTMSKKITVAIEKDSIAGNTTVTVKYSMDIGAGLTHDVDRFYEEETVIFDNYSSGDTLPAVYIYYFPLYGTSSRDTITVQNESNIPVDLFLIAMNNDKTTLFNKESYRAKLELREDQNLSAATPATKVHSNVTDEKWTKSSNVVRYSTSGWGVSDLGNADTRQLSYKVTITVYKHDERMFSTVDGVHCFHPENGKKICTISGTVMDSSVKER